MADDAPPDAATPATASSPTLPAQRSEAWQLVRKVGPWAVALALLVWLFRAHSVDEIWRNLRAVSLPLFAGLVVAYVGAILVADAFATWTTFRYAIPGSRVPWVDVVRVRAVTYLLAVVNYSVGQGGIAYLLHRRHGIPLAASAGAVLLTMGVNALLMAGFAGLGMLFGGAPSDPALRAIVAALGAGFPLYLCVIAVRPRFLASRKLLAPLFDAGVRGHLYVAAARVPHVLVLMAGHFCAMRLFGIDVPVGNAAALLPILFVIAVLPISPAGLGTGQATAVFLFAAFAPGATLEEQRATVLAYSLSLHFAALLTQALMGLPFLRSMTRAGAPRSA
jgi:uncharacterized membrane protein YbhN (UPF0104 family)